MYIYKGYYQGEFSNGEKNGKAKEFKNNKLIFEGEYLNGEKNGYGKQYDEENGQLIFEGEYKNGKYWNGKGKIDISSSNIFEGEIKNGIQYNGKGYDKEGKLLYELNNGDGLIKEYYDKLIIYRGENLNQYKLEGKVKGKEYYYNGKLIFDGEYLNENKWTGKIYKYLNNNELVFEGEYLMGDIWKGKGREYNSLNKITFEGEYINGLKNGNGEKYYKPKDCKTNRYNDNNNNICFYKGKLGEYLNDAHDVYNNRNIKYKGE